MIKGVIFDLDDTLYDYSSLNKEAMNRLEDFTCGRLNIDPEEFQKAFTYGRNKTKQGIETLAAAHNRLLYMQRTLEYLHKNPFSYALEMYEVYWDYFLDNMKLISGSEEVLLFLQKKNIKLAICTDLTAHIQHRKIRKLGLDKYIQYVVTSEEAGIEKPALRMFELTLEKMNLPAHEVLYIGDSYKRDIEGATNAGMRTCWYNLGKETSLGEKTTFQFSKYKELEGILQNEFKKY